MIFFCNLHIIFLICRPDPKEDVWIRWDDTGSENIVSRPLLQYDRPLRAGSTVIMQWKGNFYKGTVLDVATPSSSEDSDSETDSDSDLPLAKIRRMTKGMFYFS